MRRPILLLTLPLLALACSRNRTDESPAPVVGTTAKASLRTADGRSVGDIAFVQTANGVLMLGLLANLPPGTHGFHVHAIGKCAPTFADAGGHFAPSNRQHGFRSAMGPHAGDLPNINVAADGTVRVEVFSQQFNLGRDGAGIFDDDGAAIMVHALADDYTTDPSGSSGDRIACGVITR